ncbi:MAG TPA: DUF559 domain-containing protein [Actinomycetota bacterium]|nr:DUF559 domain-containing protein [Actinomycetota bacterium]
MPGPQDLVPLERIAAKQFGVFTYDQALSVDISRSCLRVRRANGAVIEMLPLVYRFNAVAESFEQRIMAAYLWGGRDAVISHSTAGLIWGCDGVAPGPVHLTLAMHTRSPDSWMIVHTGTPPSRKRALFRVTTMPQTLLGMASERLPRLGTIFDDAIHRRLTTIDDVRALMDESPPGTRGLRGLRALVAQYDTGPALESALEARLLKLIRQHRLPEPVRQHVVLGPNGSKIRLDFAYPHLKLAIECDGFAYHGARGDWQKDLDRGNRLTIAGWRVIHVTWEQVCKHPEAVIRQIRAALDAADPTTFPRRRLTMSR